MTLLCTKYYHNWSMNVEDIASQSSVIFWAWLKRPSFGVHESKGSAETLVRRGGITNYRLIAYSFSNISAKNYQNRFMCIEVIACNVSVVFLRHSVLQHWRIVSHIIPTIIQWRFVHDRLDGCHMMVVTWWISTTADSANFNSHFAASCMQRLINGRSHLSRIKINFNCWLLHTH